MSGSQVFSLCKHVFLRVCCFQRHSGKSDMNGAPGRVLMQGLKRPSSDQGWQEPAEQNTEEQPLEGRISPEDS